MFNIVEEEALGRRERRKQDRRQAIVDVARHSFIKNGYAATSMSGLVKILGGSKATLWSYFHTKEELFAAVIDEIVGVFRSELQTTLSCERPLKLSLIAYCRNFMEAISDPESLAAWRLIIAESGRFPEIGRIFHDHAVRQNQITLHNFLAHHVATGALRSEKPAQMASFLESLCAADRTHLLWGINAIDSETRDTKARRFTEYFLQIFAGPSTEPISRFEWSCSRSEFSS